LARARYSVIRRIAASLALLLLPACASAQAPDADDLAKKLQNPLSNLISLPIESNWEFATASSYDWTAGLWTMPLEVSASQIVKLGGQMMSVGLTVRSHLARPPLGPQWGLTFTATFLFPKGA